MNTSTSLNLSESPGHRNVPGSCYTVTIVFEGGARLPACACDVVKYETLYGTDHKFRVEGA